MDEELIDLYECASAWTLSMVPGAAEQLDAPTPCEGWDVKTLMNHMVDTGRYFKNTALGEPASLPSPEPPSLIGDDPVEAFEAMQADLIRAFQSPGVLEEHGVGLGIAFSDQLLHGWDLAKATAQDATMPENLPQKAFDIVHRQFTEEQRTGVFKPEIKVPVNASAQDKLLAFTGRDPSQWVCQANLAPSRASDLAPPSALGAGTAA